jgi:Protein of unknown function (DUF4231)
MNDTMHLASPEDFKNHPAWLRLKDQLNWYEKKSTWNKKCYKILRISQLVLAATISVIALSGAGWSKWVTAGSEPDCNFGGNSATESIGPQWIEYQSIAEDLRCEKFLFLSESGHYRNNDPSKALHVLAERVEENVIQEHGRLEEYISTSPEEKE